MKEMQDFSPEEKADYLVVIFCDVYTNFTNGQCRYINGKKLADVLFEEMSDKLSEATRNGYNGYVTEISRLWKNMSAEADRRIIEADRRIAEARQTSAEAMRRSAEAMKSTEEKLKQIHTIYKNTPMSNEALQLAINIKNGIRDLEKEASYKPTKDMELILKRIEQLEIQSKQP
jgi:hypothetical protein